MGDFNFKIPKELHKKFKIYAINEGRDMQDILIDLIKKEVNLE